MKKLFLIPLMACFTCVMAWGVTYQVGDYAQLKAALEAGDATLIELTADITYPGTWATFTGKQPAPDQKKDEILSTLNPTLTELENALTVKNSLTLDGKGFQLIGFGKQNINADASTNNHRATLVIRPDNTSDAIQVTVKNLSLGNTVKNLRYYGIIAFDGVSKVIYDNINVVCNNYSYQQALCFTGANDTPIDVTIKDSYLNSGNTAYSVYILKPIKANISNTTIEGWCAIYFKYRATGVYGGVVGSRGSKVTCDACQFICPNVHSGESNSFALFPMEDDGITMNFNNCSFNAEQIGDQQQSIFSMQYRKRDSGYQPIVLNITGDNTHMYNISMVHLFDQDGDPFGAVFEEYSWWKSTGFPNMTLAEAPLSLTIEGGVFSINPETISFPDENGERVYANIPATDTVQEVKQGDETLYRIVKKAKEKSEGVMYDLNDQVADEGIAEGNNPVSSFDLSTGETMKLDEEREVTKAGYVQVKDNEDSGKGTVVKVGTTETADPTKKVDQTLVINNGLDVQGESTVEVQAGSALIIGKGGITTENPENIVIEADKEGAATLLMDPTITVNQTPELTVKMVAQNVGKIGSDYYWHRFALPVDEVHVDAVDPSKSTWIKDGHDYGTLLYKWDYENNKWASLTNVNQMQPFYGYTMTITSEVANPSALKNAGYIFKGNLTGNVNSVLNFSRQGYNFFGNSYTGYISIVQLIEELIGNENLDGTVWMWNPGRQQYEGIPLNDLKNNPTAARYIGKNSWKAEVAPMQTFILRLMTEDTDTKANINYATAVWGNPRYKDVTGVSLAPARHIESTEDAYVRIVVSAANGKADAINFQEDANLSDANDRGFDAAKYMNERTINVYSTINGENYGTVATDNIEGKKLTINTIDEIAYTISFEDVEGNEYALRDNVTGKVIAIEEGTTYEFAAQPNSVVEGRFEIVSIAKVPTSIENTEVKANAKGIYTIMGQYLGEDFQALPAGVYVVDGVKIVK